MSVLLKRVPGGEAAPRHYGRAYSLCDRDMYVAAVFPLNHLIGWTMELWFRIRHCSAHRRDRRTFQQGYDRGFNDCAEGARARHRAIERQLNAAHSVIQALSIRSGV